MQMLLRSALLVVALAVLLPPSLSSAETRFHLGPVSASGRLHPGSATLGYRQFQSPGKGVRTFWGVDLLGVRGGDGLLPMVALDGGVR